MRSLASPFLLSTQHTPTHKKASYRLNEISFFQRYLEFFGIVHPGDGEGVGLVQVSIFSRLLQIVLCPRILSFCGCGSCGGFDFIILFFVFDFFGCEILDDGRLLEVVQWSLR